MKRVLLMVLCVLGVCTIAYADVADSLSLPLPQFMNPFYDSFSRNYMGAAASGRGYTGAAYLGDVCGLSLNPASLLPDSTAVSAEMDLKLPVRAGGYPSIAYYSTRNPFGLVAVNGKFNDNISAAVTYSLPKSIYLDDFSIIINQGAGIVQRFPSYYLNQLTLNAAYHKNNWHLGLNLNNQLHYIDDPIFLHTWERIRSYKYAIRVQPGIVYSGKRISFGASAMPPVEFNWDLKFAKYKVLEPLWVNAGLSLTNKENRYLFDAEYEEFSKIDFSYHDRLMLKAGYEKDMGKVVYRLGYLYSPEVYSGVIRLPQNPEASVSSSYWWGDVSRTLLIYPNEQHFLTGGFSYYHKYGTFSASAMQVVSGGEAQFQFAMNLSFYLDSIRRLGQRKPSE